MVLQIGLGIDPGRVGQVQRHPPQPAPQYRHQRQALGHVAAQMQQKAALEAGRQLVEVERAHMHGHLGGFEVEEGGIQARELLHGVDARPGGRPREGDSP